MVDSKSSSQLAAADRPPAIRSLSLTFRPRLAIFNLLLMHDIVENSFELRTPAGDELYGDIRWEREMAESRGKMPCIIVCHGFKAFKDWGPFPAIGRHFAGDGFVSIVFNFSHNGIGKNFKKFSEHKKFFEGTISLELDDVKTILDAIWDGRLGEGKIDKSKIAIVGHSRGGGVAIVEGEEDERVKAVVGWSTISKFDRYSEGQRKRWREGGSVVLASTSRNNPFKLGTALLDDLEQNAERLNIERAVHSLGKPLLLLHGTADVPVPVQEVRHLYDASDHMLTDLIELDGVGHMYGARHPYKSPTPTMNHILELTSAWLHKHL